eukprot:535705_1
MSKKRPHTTMHCESNTNQLPLKKQKLASNHNHTSSSFFTHILDNEQYQQIFNAIDNSPMIQSLHITHSISSNIAEFASGRFKKCVNDKCKNDISILHQDRKIYDNNHENSVQVGYKWCVSDKLFCSDCMDLVTPCDCDECERYDRGFLIFALNKCDSCMTPMTYYVSIDIDCERSEWICDKCKGKYCRECNVLQFLCCTNCGDYMCNKCYIIPKGWDEDECVCHKCYDWNETVIECENCNVKYELLFKGNNSLWNTELDCRMEKCGDENCNLFICTNCYIKQQNAKQYFCKDFACQILSRSGQIPCGYSAYFCNQHPPMQAFCRKALIKKKNST